MLEGLGPVAGRYRLMRELGRGSFATVYLAEDTTARKPVAVKVLSAARPDGLGEVAGTPQSLAPEQVVAGAARATPAVDVYAAGVLLYELLARRPPFGESPSWGELAKKIQETRPASVDTINALVPPAVA